jgi:catechol 2,3-dioxygenase-like lactoylglutathione lyase family enzyme
VRKPFIDHLTVEVSNFEASRRFYEGALAPFGVNVIETISPDTGKPELAFGPAGSEDFLIKPGESAQPLHVAFAAPDQDTVHAFHAAALAAGGQDNGGPGTRVKYSDRYYAAYVLDPDGNNVEAVFHAPEAT